MTDQEATPRKGEYARCSVCRRWIGAYVPKGGDGTLLHVRQHNKVETMGGITTIVHDEPCKGSNRPELEINP